ncbi:MAG TPA: pirin family protein [Nitrospiria bacterium]|nr:pirin family protein [Nitrospiria bacterium]
MSQTRKINVVWKNKPTLEGAGVHLKRVFGFPQLPKLDPFLMMDDFSSNEPSEYLAGFPWHPHRGIETITYVVDGEVEHQDSMKNSGVISSGDVQWMTAGSGILHQEMPKIGPNKKIWGYQLWANLPASEKMMDPRYRDVKAKEIPEVKLPSGVTVKIVAGNVDGISGPVKDIVIDPEYMDISIPPETRFSHPVKPGHTVFAYVVAGRAEFSDSAQSGSQIGPGNLVLYYHEGDQIEVQTGESGVRFLLLAGKPLGEPIAWYGPIVMNTDEELKVAFEEFRKGGFIKKKAS